MENYLKEIEKKIQGEIEIEEIKIIDNSQEHKKHKFCKFNRKFTRANVANH